MWNIFTIFVLQNKASARNSTFFLQINDKKCAKYNCIDNGSTIFVYLMAQEKMYILIFL